MQIAIFLILQNHSLSIRQLRKPDILRRVHRGTEKHLETLIRPFVGNDLDFAVDLVLDLQNFLIKSQNRLLDIVLLLPLDDSGLEPVDQLHVALLDTEGLGEVALDLGEQGQVFEAVFMEEH